MRVEGIETYDETHARERGIHHWPGTWARPRRTFTESHRKLGTNHEDPVLEVYSPNSERLEHRRDWIIIGLRDRCSGRGA